MKLIRQPSPPPMEAPVQLLTPPPQPQPHPSAVADPRPGPAPTAAMEDLSDNSKGPKGLHIVRGLCRVRRSASRLLPDAGLVGGGSHPA